MTRRNFIKGLCAFFGISLFPSLSEGNGYMTDTITFGSVEWDDINIDSAIIADDEGDFTAAWWNSEVDGRSHQYVQVWRDQSTTYYRDSKEITKEQAKEFFDI